MVVLLLTVFGCSARAGEQPSASAWKEQADQVLGAAEGSLGTAQLLLDAELRKKIPTSYAVVGMQDALTALEKKAQTFLEARPAPGTSGPDRQAVEAVLSAQVLLHTALDAASGSSSADRRTSLEQVRRAHDAVEKLRKQVAG